MQNVQNVNSDLGFKYNWNLEDGYPKIKHNKTVFSTFACGGGSTMGYKLAGYDVMGANDIDPSMEKIYKRNHDPKYFFLCPVKDLIKKDLPKEFYGLDVLDGSPPCSVFSMAGLREKGWQKEKYFREGQKRQILDDLFFDFMDLLGKLNPRIGIAENVSGMLKGHAKHYCFLIREKAKEYGYHAQLFLLNAATMGVPQNRSRVFFVFTKTQKKIKLDFNCPVIPWGQIRENVEGHGLTEKYQEYWRKAKQGKWVGLFRSVKKANNLFPIPAILASRRHYDSTQPRKLTDKEILLASSFPLDYNYEGMDINYLCGMSVPPVMMANVANELYLQLLK